MCLWPSGVEVVPWELPEPQPGMYFACKRPECLVRSATPNTGSLDQRGSGCVRSFAVCETRKLIIAMTLNEVQVWSGGSHRLLLSSVEWRPLQPELEDRACHVSWHPTENMFAALRTPSILRVYRYEYTKRSPPLLPKPSWFRGDTEDDSTEEQVELTLHCAFQIELDKISGFGKADSLFTLRDEIFVSSTTGVVCRLSWSCTIRQTLPFPTGRILHCHVMGTTDAIIFVDDKGNAGLFHCPEEMHDVKAEGVHFFHTGGHVCCASASTNTFQAAVGTIGGDIFIYAINVTRQPKIAPTFSSSLFATIRFGPDMHNGELSRQVSSLAWSPDDAVLASGYLEMGFCLWSPAGCRVSSALPQDGKRSNIACGGVRAMAWVAGGSFLLVSSETTQYSALQSDKNLERHQASFFVHEWTFCKSFESTFSCGTDRGMTFVGPSCIYTLPKLNSMPVDGPRWLKLSPPRSYLAHSMPLRICEYSPSGRFLVIAGARGFSLYNCLAKSWQLMDRHQQEKDTCVAVIRWVDDDSFACVESEEVTFWSRHCLDKNGLLVSVSVRTPLSFVADIVVLGTKRNFCAICHRCPLDGHVQVDTMHLCFHATQKILSITHMPEHQFNVRGGAALRLSVYGWADQSSSGLGSVAMAILRNDGTVSVTKYIRESKEFKISIEGPVANLWHLELSYSSPVFWFYGRNAGLVFWSPNEDMCDNETVICGEFDFERLPIGVCSSKLMFAFTEQHIFVSPSRHAYFDGHLHTHVCMTSPILYFLEKKQREAANVLFSCACTEQLAERLLRESLELAYKHRRVLGAPFSAVLLTVLQLLKQYKSWYTRIVSRVARGVERSRWPLLFPMANSPTVLFENALAHGDAASAMNCIVLMAESSFSIQSDKSGVKMFAVESVEAAIRCSRRLLEGILAEPDNVDLARQVQRYLLSLQLQKAEVERQCFVGTVIDGL